MIGKSRLKKLNSLLTYDARIILNLLNSDETYRSAIARETGIVHTTVATYLNRLENAGEVRYREFGRIRLYSLTDRGKKRAKILAELLQ